MTYKEYLEMHGTAHRLYELENRHGLCPNRMTENVSNVFYLGSEVPYQPLWN